MSIDLGYEEAVGLLKDAILAKGKDYRYVRRNAAGTDLNCVYFETSGAPSCIIGHLLHAKGLERADLVDMGGNMAPAHHLVAAGLIKCSQETERLLTDVQWEQDRGTPWGAALEAVLAEIEAEEREQQ